jgi:hypothetical protein
MKKIFILGFTFSILFLVTSFGQNSHQAGSNSTKTDQSQLYNDVNFGYGVGSLYIFTGEVSHSYSNNSGYGTRSDINSFGALIIGYNRMVSRVLWRVT